MVYLGKQIMPNVILNPNTRDLSTMKVQGGAVERLVKIYSLEELKEFVAKNTNKNIMIVGGGTNTVFVNKNEDLVLVKLEMKGIEAKENTVEVEAGVDWDEFVQKYIELGGIGMEALSIIPGTVGAAPVQNIGAYGEEVSNFIQSVKVYDLGTKEFKELTNLDCEFNYRSSIFKENKGRYIIISILFDIKRGEVRIPQYKDVQEHFQGKEGVTIGDIRNAIIQIRNRKLPDPRLISNCGSFFKNPIISNYELKKVKEIFPEIPTYKTMEEGTTKIPAGYILERLGFKNFIKENFGTFSNNALVVVSNGKGDTKEFLDFVKSIKDKVKETTGIELVEEVNLV